MNFLILHETIGFTEHDINVEVLVDIVKAWIDLGRRKIGDHFGPGRAEHNQLGSF